LIKKGDLLCGDQQQQQAVQGINRLGIPEFFRKKYLNGLIFNLLWFKKIIPVYLKLLNIKEESKKCLEMQSRRLWRLPKMISIFLKARLTFPR
jgi:hypothetical protein